MSTCKVICVTNRSICRDDFLTRMEMIAAAHPYAVILREKDLPPEQYSSLAGKVSDICRAHNTPLILHYFDDIAGAMGADAVHLPLYKVSADVINKFKTVGASCHSAEDAVTAQKLGCKYIVAGHIFPTECKKGVPARGLGFLREVRAAVDIPVYAIGGINADNAKIAFEAGADGVCAMSGFMLCEDAAAYIKQLEGANG